MKGKYDNIFYYCGAYLYRQLVRHRVSKLISRPTIEKTLEPGCTALVGMSHQLPDVLLGNLCCLETNVWEDLKEVIVVVDGTRKCLPEGFESNVINSCPGLNIKFFYYSEFQYLEAKKILLPYVFSWLSWSIGMSHCRTRVAILHDYDALILTDRIQKRYSEFCNSNLYFQGIKWYNGNGISTSDRLATTFEMFFDLEWVLSFNPIEMFNQIGMLNGKSVDYDTLLKIQANDTPKRKRSIARMEEFDIVHPSQMIHQYTMFKRFPGKAQPCFSIPMIPFFEYLSGKDDALLLAKKQLENTNSKKFYFLNNNSFVNFSQLSHPAVDWLLKQMVQVCVSQNIPPFKDLHDYGRSLYRFININEDNFWSGDFTDEQRNWITKASLCGT